MSSDTDALSAPGAVAEGKRPLLLDVFSGAGGLSVGYHRAGFEVVGIDIAPQPRFPYEFVQADAIEQLAHLIDGGTLRVPVAAHHGYTLTDFAAIHASPVCHDWSALSSISGKDGSAELLHLTMELLPLTGLPWVVENVVGAPLCSQTDLFGRHGVELCGTMFGLGVLRHRLFETSFPLDGPPPHGSHVGEFYSPAGHGDPNWKRRDANPHLNGPGYADRCRKAMGIDWMNRDELAQAVPPAYSEWVGKQLLAVVNDRKVAAA